MCLHSLLNRAVVGNHSCPNFACRAERIMACRFQHPADGTINAAGNEVDLSDLDF